MPTVSVIIPTRNRPLWLVPAVDSVRAQTFQDFEIILVLNGADRETHAAADRLGADPRVRVVRTGESTASEARNRGLALAHGDWLAFLDDDDIWLPTKLDAQLATAHETGADLVACNFILFNDSGDILPSGLSPRPDGLSFAEALMLDNYVAGGSAALVRTEVMRRLGGFDERLIGAEDWDMWRRVSWDHHIHFLDQVLVKYRRHGANKGADPAFALPGKATHFGKMLRDTPARLQHMLPAAKRQFAHYLAHTLAAERLFEDATEPADWRTPTAQRESLDAARHELVAELAELKSEIDALRAERDALNNEKEELPVRHGA